jgi:hypothetical protein
MKDGHLFVSGDTNTYGLSPPNVVLKRYDLDYMPSLIYPLINTTFPVGNVTFGWSSANSPRMGLLNFTFELSSDYTFSNVVLRELNIPEQAITTSAIIDIYLQTGLYYWRIIPSHGIFNGTPSEIRMINFIRNINAPSLENGHVTPSSGNQTSLFTFRVTYYDLDDNPPQSINITINGTVFMLTKQDPEDRNYLDGCIFQYSSFYEHQNATYVFSFSCNDGVYGNISTLIVGPVIVETNSNAPTLSSPTVTPLSGTNTTVYTLSVIYTDVDNNYPQSISVIVNNNTYLMMQDNPLDTDMTDGALYSYSSTFYWGFYQVQFNCTDGRYTDSTGWSNIFENNPFAQNFLQITIFQDTFESGMAKWQNLSSLWHLTGPGTSWPNSYRSATHSIWFGQETTGNYATGSRVCGDAVSIPFSLDGLSKAYVEFYHWRACEDGVDRSSVLLSIDGGNTWLVLWQSSTNVSPWQLQVINITQYCGYSNVLLRFSFDSFDGVDNSFRGWLVDDVRVRGEGYMEISLLSPVNGVTVGTNNVTFTWTSMMADFGAVLYEWQLSNTSDFSTLIDLVSGIPETAGTTSMTRIIPSGQGTLFWRVRAVFNGCFSHFDSFFRFEIPPNMYVPELVNGTVSPSSGDQFTVFSFSVVYRDMDNNMPEQIYVHINGTAYTMPKAIAEELDYRIGCTYRFSSQFPHQTGNMSFYFSCSDGMHSNISTTFFGPSITEVNSFCPELLNPVVFPLEGTNSTLFTFAVQYKDVDNNYPSMITITINATTHAMTPVDTTDENMVDGRIYYYMTPLVWGSSQFQINCSDGAFYNSTGWCVGPNIHPFNILGNISVFIDDYESGMAKWQNLSSLWHLTGPGTSWPNSYRSATHSIWFGQETTGNYATGSRVCGDAVSIPFSLDGLSKAYVEFYHWRACEDGVDRSSVLLSIDGGNTWLVLWQSSTNVSPWQLQVINITQYCGYSNVLLRFSFDSFDGVDNSFRGWLVDDVRVRGEGYMEISLLSPVNGVTVGTNNVTFTWTSMMADFGAVLYEWQLSNTSDFSTLIDLVSGIPETAGTTSMTRIIPSGQGTLFWRVRPTYGAVHGNFSSTSSFNVPYRFAPLLEDGTVEPLNGNQSTSFNFSVIYYSIDNAPPSFINVSINWLSYGMVKQNPLDNNYTDGCLYVTTKSLPQGWNYTFKFSCSDGVNDTSTVNFSGPNILQSAIIHYQPIAGPTYERGNITFEWNNIIAAGGINYTLQISSALDFSENLQEITGIEEQPGNTTSKNVTILRGGCLYWRIRPNHDSFLGIWSPSFEFTVQNRNPVLSTDVPSLVEGDGSTEIQFQVVYSDLDNDAPSIIVLFIDHVLYPLSKQDPSDADYRDGVTYVGSVVLMEGDHDYYFLCNDGISGNITLTSAIRVTTDLDRPLSPEEIAGIFIIILGIVAGMMLFVISKKRRKPNAIIQGKPVSTDEEDDLDLLDADIEAELLAGTGNGIEDEADPTSSVSDEDQTEASDEPEADHEIESGQKSVQKEDECPVDDSTPSESLEFVDASSSTSRSVICPNCRNQFQRSGGKKHTCPYCAFVLKD